MLNATFANATFATQTYNGTTNTGNNAPGTGRSNQNSLGYAALPGTSFGDTTYSLSFNAMTNASGSITFTFTGLLTESSDNESFGLNNIRVNGTVGGQPSAVPEPTTMLLLGTGLAGVAIKARKRRNANRSEDV